MARLLEEGPQVEDFPPLEAGRVRAGPEVAVVVAEGPIAAPVDNSDPASSSPSSQTSSSFSRTQLIHYGVVALLLLGGGLYWALTPPTLNPVTDPRAAEAIALVQTHRALGVPTLLQALNEHIRMLSDQGLGVRAGAWMVKPLGGERYLVGITVREQGSTKQWFEREYQWEANLATKTVIAASMAAEGLMPVNESGRMPLIPPAR